MVVAGQDVLHVPDVPEALYSAELKRSELLEDASAVVERIGLHLGCFLLRS